MIKLRYEIVVMSVNYSRREQLSTAFTHWMHERILDLVRNPDALFQIKIIPLGDENERGSSNS